MFCKQNIQCISNFVQGCRFGILDVSSPVMRGGVLVEDQVADILLYVLLTVIYPMETFYQDSNAPRGVWKHSSIDSLL